MQERQRAFCPGGCGQPRSESFAPDNEGAYTAEAWLCHACAARAHEAEHFTSDGGDPAGLFIVVTKDREDGAGD